MPTLYERPPLVEAILELRWLPGTAALPPESGTTSTIDFTKMEEFFMKLSGELYGHSYQRAERLVPPGFFVPPHTVTLRLHHITTNNLFQVGPGVFTANALPPYKTWDEFRPVLQLGVEALLKARPVEEQARGFNAISLRYLNSFGASLWEGASPYQFLEKLGFGIVLPKSISGSLKANNLKSLAFQCQFKLDNDFLVNLAFQEGRIHNEPSMLMDTFVSTAKPCDASVDAVLEFLDRAHAINRDVFFGLVNPIETAFSPTRT